MGGEVIARSQPTYLTGGGLENSIECECSVTSQHKLVRTDHLKAHFIRLQ